MKYFIDTEFLEGTQTKRVLDFNVGQTKPTIDLISIGIVAEDGREYYAISKEFNLKEAWNRFELKPDIDNGGMKKVYWIRENVLKPIWNDLNGAEVYGFFKTKKDRFDYKLGMEFSYRSLKYLLNEYGKTNAQIAEEVKEFVNGIGEDISVGFGEHQFYGYYADYDWVVFCWLFGKMIDLPDGFPMYCIDLKQEIDSWVNGKGKHEVRARGFDLTLKRLKDRPDYPKQTNEHNALDDARWNKKLYEFLKSL